jgi:hypothetical protein
LHTDPWLCGTGKLNYDVPLSIKSPLPRPAIGIRRKKTDKRLREAAEKLSVVAVKKYGLKLSSRLAHWADFTM